MNRSIARRKSLTATAQAYDGGALSGCTIAQPTVTDSNPKGARTAMCDGSCATSWTHDAMGRILTETRALSGVTATLSYAYNLDSSIYWQILRLRQAYHSNTCDSEPRLGRKCEVDLQ